MTTSWDCVSPGRNANALWIQSLPSPRDLPNHHLHDGLGMYRRQKDGTGEAALSTLLAMAVKDDLPAQSETTALAMTDTENPLTV